LSNNLTLNKPKSSPVIPKKSGLNRNESKALIGNELSKRMHSNDSKSKDLSLNSKILHKKRGIMNTLASKNPNNIDKLNPGYKKDNLFIDTDLELED